MSFWHAICPDIICGPAPVVVESESGEEVSELEVIEEEESTVLWGSPGVEGDGIIGWFANEPVEGGSFLEFKPEFDFTPIAIAIGVGAVALAFVATRK